MCFSGSQNLNRYVVSGREIANTIKVSFVFIFELSRLLNSFSLKESVGLLKVGVMAFSVILSLSFAVSVESSIL